MVMINGGQSYVSAPPAFSNDRKKLLVCTGDTVSVFSTTTGLLVTELEGHTDRVTSVVVVPAEPSAVKFVCYCWTSSLDGTICYWDFSVPEPIKKVQVSLPIFSMAIPSLSSAPSASVEKKPSLYAFISVEDTNKPADQHKTLRGRIQICDLTSSRRVGGILTETRKAEQIIVSPSMKYFGIQNKRKIHIWAIPTQNSNVNDIKMIKLHHTKSLNALAFHPTMRIVAGGDITGRILIWRGFGSRKFLGRKSMDEEEGPQNKADDDADLSPTTWHWHAAEVKFLSFSSNGSYLYSGGKEGVIVVWQFDTGKQKFKPRLGSPLLYFAQSPDPAVSCVSCADNQIHLLEMPSMDIVKSISGVKLPFSHSDDDLGNGLAFDTAAGLIALCAENYCVQFFSLFDNRGLSQIQVCERNYQPIEDVTVIIARVALSVDGTMMATVEVKHPEESIGGLVTLKFWQRGSHPGDYMLSTIIYEPHCDAGVSDLAFHPNNSMAVSSSYGGDFKIWVHCSDLRQKTLDLKSGWRCQSVGSYKKSPMTSAAFSADGSVLAIAAETVVTLWDPNTNILVAVLGESITPIKRLSFIGKSEYLVTMSHGLKPQLTVWNLSKLSIHWSYNLLTEALSCNGDGSHFAVLAFRPRLSDCPALKEQDGFILLFDVENPVPIATWSVKKARGGGLAFLHSDLSSHHQKVTDETVPQTMLVYVNGDHEYIIFDPYSNEKSQIGSRARGNNAPIEEAEWMGYSSIYGKLPEHSLNSNQIPAISLVPSERPWETIFNGSSHVLPPLTKLCSAFLESLLERKTTIVE